MTCVVWAPMRSLNVATLVCLSFATLPLRGIPALLQHSIRVASIFAWHSRRGRLTRTALCSTAQPTATILICHAAADAKSLNVIKRPEKSLVCPHRIHFFFFCECANDSAFATHGALQRRKAHCDRTQHAISLHFLSISHSRSHLWRGIVSRQLTFVGSFSPFT